jgi:hypothetical protein
VLGQIGHLLLATSRATAACDDPEMSGCDEDVIGFVGDGLGGKRVGEAHKRIRLRRLLDTAFCCLLTSSTARIFSASLSLPIQRSLRSV